MQFHLRWKILLLAVVAPLLLGIESLHLVDTRVTRNIRSSIDQALSQSSLVCQSVLETRADLLESSAQVIAGDPRFFATLAIPVSSRDARFQATVQDVARDFNRIAKADIFEVLDPTGRVVASVGNAATTPAGREGLPVPPGGTPAAGLLAQDSSLFIVSRSPVNAAGRTVGVLLLGTRLGDELAGDLRNMTRSEVSFLTGGEFSGTTLASRAERQALRDTIDQGLASKADLVRAGVLAVRHGGMTYLTLVRALPWTPPGGQDLVVLQRSLEGESAFLRDIQRGLGELGLLTLLATLLLGLIVSQRITRPILQLVRGASEIAKGNYEYPLDIRTRDEIGYLARRFEDMREHERVYIRNLQEIVQLKSNFIDVASHELRTPTSVIMGYASLLAQGGLGQITADQRQAIEAIEQNISAIARIAEDATSIAQIEEQRRILDREESDVRCILEEAVDIARSEATGRRVTVSVEVEDDPLKAELDGPRMVQAIAHLVRNGIRFTPDGGSIRVRATMEGPELVVRVRDTGIGISPDIRERVFAGSLPLRDVLHHHSSSGLDFKSAGLGLGLLITRGIVEAHGGSITVTSREGEGSVFTIRLPSKTTPEIASAA